MILYNAFILSFLVMFVWSTTWSKMIFDKPATWMDENMPEIFNKILWKCPVCMTPYYGLAGYVILNFFGIKTDFNDSMNFLIIIPVSAGINAILSQFIN